MKLNEDRREFFKTCKIFGIIPFHPVGELSPEDGTYITRWWRFNDKGEREIVPFQEVEEFFSMKVKKKEIKHMLKELKVE